MNENLYAGITSKIINRIIIISVVYAVVFAISAFTSEAQEELLKKLSTNYSSIRVNKVLTVNTILLENDETIRLIGIRAPELPKHKKSEKIKIDFIQVPVRKEASPLETVEQKAFTFTKELLEGKKIRLEFDKQKSDDDFKTIAYVFLEDDTFVNAEILRQGYGFLRIKPPNLKYADILRSAYKESRQEKRGLQNEY